MTKPARRKRRTPEDLRDLILSAAAREFSANGYSGATTAAIARGAQTTEAQIFRLFASKAELFREAVFQPLGRHFADFHARQGSDETLSMRSRAESYIGELQDFLGQHSRLLMSIAVASTYDQGAKQSLADIESLAAYFDRGAAMMASRGAGHGAGEPRVPPELMVRVSFAAVLGSVLFRDWLFPPGLADDAAIRRAIADFTIDGIRANDHGL